MTTELRSVLEDEYETELSRLGSSKAMYAVTDGEMDGETVVSALADRAHAAAATFDGWTADVTDTVFADAFGAVAERARDHADRLAEEGGGSPSDDPTDLEAYLRELEDPAARAGGLLAWTLVTDRTLSQAVGFFVGNADPQSANLFRDLRGEIEDEIDRAEHLIEEVCEGAADEGRAAEAASEAIEAAYEHYVETLEDMGIKVKPVC